jgi:hypothetical protein
VPARSLLRSGSDTLEAWFSLFKTGNAAYFAELTQASGR